MTVVRRLDRVPIEIGRKQGARIDPETGFLHAPILATRTGVFAYRRADGSTSFELKTPGEVASPRSLASLERLVMTAGHPQSPITVDNVKALQIGHLGSRIDLVDRNGEAHVRVDGVVTDKDAIAAMLGSSGDFSRRDRPALTHVSMGYSTTIIDEDGIYKGQRYNARHTDIVYNHIAAAIPLGRAGTAEILLDAAGGDPFRTFLVDDVDAVALDDRTDSRSNTSTFVDLGARPKAGTMNIRITLHDGTQVELDPATGHIVRAELSRLTAKADEAERRVKQLETDLAAAKAEATGLQAKLDQAAADKAKTDATPKADVGAAALELLAVLDAADVILDLGKLEPSKRQDARTALLQLEPGEAGIANAIRREVVTRVCVDEAEALRKRDDVYIEARFDAMRSSTTRAAAEPPPRRSALDEFVPPRQPAPARRIADRGDAWAQRLAAALDPTLAAKD